MLILQNTQLNSLFAFVKSTIEAVIMYVLVSASAEDEVLIYTHAYKIV